MKKILLSISVLLTAVCCLAVTAYSVDKLKVNTEKLEISKVSDADMPSGKQLKSVKTAVPEVYLRGEMNTWGALAEWEFEHVENAIYKFVTPEPIMAGIPFKVADDSWGNINYSTNFTDMYPEVTYEMFIAGVNMSFAEDFSGVIWIDVDIDSPKFECSGDLYYVPEWVNGGTLEAWKSIGKGTYREGIFSSLFLGLDSELIEVEIEQSEDNPNAYRMVNPYANWTNPYSNVEYDSARIYYLNFNIEEVDGVKYWYMPKDYQPLGVIFPEITSGASGMASLFTQVGTMCAEYGVARVLETYGESCLGKYEDGVLTYPATMIAEDSSGNLKEYSNIILHLKSQSSGSGFKVNTKGQFGVAMPGHSIEIEEENIEWVTVHVENPGEFAEVYLTQNNYDWDGVYYLKVTGNLGEQDLKNIKNVSHLMKLDLSETSITAIPPSFMYNQEYLKEVSLPSTVKTIGNEAFRYCRLLKKVNVSGVESIGEYAFAVCGVLEDINLTGVKSIGEGCFNQCGSLGNVDLSTIEVFGNSAFYACANISEVNLSSLETAGGGVFNECSGLKSVIFPEEISNIPYGMFANSGLESIIIPDGVVSLDPYAFVGCISLKEVVIPVSLKSIGSEVFEGCTSLESVELPAGLRQIWADAFNGCTALSEITIPELVNYLGSRVFGNTGITRIKSKAVTPPSLDGSMFESGKDMTAMELYVPSISKDAYRNSDYWSEFYIMRSLEEPISNIRVTSPLTINLREEDGALLSAKPSISLTSNDFNTYSTNELGQLTAIGEGTLSAGELFFESAVDARYYSYRWSNGGRYPTLINYADKMRADNVTHVFHFPNTTNPWAFISLPYDVKVSDIVPSNDTYWVIRRYDSAARAAGETGSTWVNLTNDDTLEAGKGYIVSVFGGEIREDGYRNLPNLTFSSGNSVTKNNIFRSTDVIVPLAEYESEYAHNRSWNFIGNPYPSYFDMHCLNEEFTAPITIWNGRSYVAYSPVDDDLVLRPYESFFVQCPLNANSITFKEEGRMHYYEGYDRIKVRPRSLAEASLSAEDRNVFNFTIKGDNSEDRTRIVFNRDAASTYEVGCDASKFFADDNAEAQIFVKGDVDYSICERPVADAEAVLGISGGVDKTYTISLSGRYSDEWRVLLTDNVTGITVDLTKEDYEFVANGDNGSRFGIRFELAGNVESGIQGITGDFGAEAEVSVCTLDGVTVFRGRASEISVESAGLYIVTDGEKSRKAILK